MNQCCQLDFGNFESENYFVKYERFEFYGIITISVMFTNKTLMQFAFSFKDTFFKKCINREGEKTLAVSNLLSHAVKKNEKFTFI